MEKEAQMYKLVVLTISVGLLTALGSADAYGDSGGDYWPTWRGPEATGVAPKANPPLTWSETRNIKWKVKLPGQGTSSPVIWGDRIFFLTAIETDKKSSPVFTASFSCAGLRLAYPNSLFSS